MTERALFHAYRHAHGHYEAECACGEVIYSEKGDEQAVGQAIDAHNLTPLHVQWREWQDAVKAIQRAPRRPCPCHGA